jgi:rod shape-determining protein MreB and related proteins
MKNTKNTPKHDPPAKAADEETVLAQRPIPKTTTLLVGLDLGTNKSCIQSALPNTEATDANRLIPSVVGYAKDGLLEDILPGNALRFYGQEAIDNRLHLRLVPPLKNGTVAKNSAAKDYLRHLRVLIGHDQAEVRAVIGLPANADAASREKLTSIAGEVFDRIIAIPEPFLAALGMRDESRVGQPDYVDPVRNSLFIDIGAGTTDLCLVQGCYPSQDDQVSLRFGGDQVDDLLGESIRRVYPECDLSTVMVRELKERVAFVGEPDGEVETKVIIGGKTRTLALTDQVRVVCEKLLDRIFDAVQRLIARAPADSVGELLQNIVLTGGGSRIRNLAPELQRRLFEEGFDNPRVILAGEEDTEFVARGALKAARRARESQWQQMAGSATSSDTVITRRGTTFTHATDTAFRRQAKSEPETQTEDEPVPAH